MLDDLQNATSMADLGETVPKDISTNYNISVAYYCHLVVPPSKLTKRRV
jgi:hypothetical protein